MATIPIGGITGNPLNLDIDMIERMEADLKVKVSNTLGVYGLTQNVHGVFSIDDLENKLGSDLCNHIGVGVGYWKIEPTNLTTDPKSHLNVDRGMAVKTLDYMFMVILAVPTGDQCKERHSATKVLTGLRFGIMGSTVAGDDTQRTWAFVREAPVIDESDNAMLYYSQVWRLAMPSIGKR
jgi:hypothetical protein